MNWQRNILKHSCISYQTNEKYITIDYSGENEHNF